MSKVKDRVCGMEIESDSAEFKVDHEGTTYYFCGPACKVTFEMGPQEDYISGKETLNMEAETAKKEAAGEQP